MELQESRARTAHTLLSSMHKAAVGQYDTMRITLASIAGSIATSGDDEATRLQKAILLGTSLAVTASAVFWGLVYMAFNEGLAASIPLSYSVVSTLSIIAVRRTRLFGPFRSIQILLILVLPFLLMLSLGGYVNGSAVIVWAFLAPLGALLCWNARQAVLWFSLFLTLLAVAGFLTPILRTENNLPQPAIVGFFIFNIGVVSCLAFLAFLHFVKQKELAMQLVQEKRDLERRNLEQELLLKQSEKLATLGKLSAGVAHEINNPASAAQRGAVQLGAAVSKLADAQLQVCRMSFSADQLQMLTEFGNRARDSRGQAIELDSLARSDRENEIEGVLANVGIDNAWDIAPTLVSMGFEPTGVRELAEAFTPEQFSTAIGVVHNTYRTQRSCPRFKPTGASSIKSGRISSTTRSTPWTVRARSE
jgi:signal transduction histidine kinase